MSFTRETTWWEMHNPRFLFWRLATRIRMAIIVYRNDRKWRKPPAFKTWMELNEHDRSVERRAFGDFRYRLYLQHRHGNCESIEPVLKLLDQEIDRR